MQYIYMIYISSFLFRFDITTAQLNKTHYSRYNKVSYHCQASSKMFLYMNESRNKWIVAAYKKKKSLGKIVIILTFKRGYQSFFSCFMIFLPQKVDCFSYDCNLFRITVSSILSGNTLLVFFYQKLRNRIQYYIPLPIKLRGCSPWKMKINDNLCMCKNNPQLERRKYRIVMYM